MNMKQLAHTGLVIGIALGLMAAAGTAEAAGRVTGLKISNLTVNNLDVDFDVTLYTTSPRGTFADGFLGREYTTRSETTYPYYLTTSTYTVTNTYPCPTTPTLTCTSTYLTYTGTTYTYTYVYQYYRTLGSPNLPAIDFGDGTTIPATQIPLDTGGAPSVYRGSFSHSYPAIGNYTLKVARYDKNPDTTLPDGGNLVTVSSSDTFSYRSAGYYRVYSSGSPVFSTSISYNNVQTTPSTPAPVGVSASTNVEILVPVELQSFEVADGSPLRRVLPAGMIGFGLLSTALGMVLYRREG